MAIEQDKDGVTVDIMSLDGGVEVREKSRFAYVIGTDGGHSTCFHYRLNYHRKQTTFFTGTVRRQLGIEFRGEAREAEKTYLADVRIQAFPTSGIHAWGAFGVDLCVCDISIQHNIIIESVFSCNVMYAGEPGRYQLIMGGASTDFASLTSDKNLQALQSEVRKKTKRDDIEITEILRQAVWV